jgi:rod shape-determining protein MreD
MRVILLAILAYILLAIAAGSGGIWPTPGGQPNICMALVVFVGLMAPEAWALPTAFLLGLGQDAISIGPLGVHAFAYGATAWILTRFQLAVDGKHPLAQAFGAGFGQFVLLMVGSIQSYLVVTMTLRAPPALELPPDLWRAVLGGVYTILLTPLVLFTIMPLRKALGFDPAERRGRVPGRSGRGLGRDSATWAGGGR